MLKKLEIQNAENAGTAIERCFEKKGIMDFFQKRAESLKNTKIHFTKNKLFHKYFSGIFG